jgi:hypothetical protein
MLKSNEVNRKFSLKAVVEKDRRWVLEKIRQNMLSLSFHLNTGVYLIDIDASRRDIGSGQDIDPADADDTEEAYVSHTKTKYVANTWRATNFKAVSNSISGFRKGEIHVSLEALESYSPGHHPRGHPEVPLHSRRGLCARGHLRGQEPGADAQQRRQLRLDGGVALRRRGEDGDARRRADGLGKLQLNAARIP